MHDYEDRTFENIRDEMLERFPEDIDIREGSIAFDSVTAMAYKIAEYYAAISACYDEVSIFTATGEYLDRFAIEHGLERIQATYAEYMLVYTGTAPPEGAEFYDEEGDVYYTVIVDENGIIRLRCQEFGAEYNNILPGTSAIPVDNIEGLETSTFGSIVVHAIDEEDDEILRARIQAKISGPAENGNKSQYKVWCESIEGVGRAIINPLKYGPNTVEAILISREGRAIDNDVVTEVQKKIDPKEPPFILSVDSNTVELGSGYGEGVAPIGAHFIAKSAKEFDIKISFFAELLDGKTEQQAKEEVEKVVTAYLKELALSTDEIHTIRISKIGSLIEQTEAVFDYRDLKVNDDTSNIVVSNEEVAVLAEVTVNELI